MSNSDTLAKVGSSEGLGLDPERYDLYEDVISRLRFEHMTRAEQHEQLKRIEAAERERCATLCRDKAAEWLKRADAGDMQRDTARHASIAAGQIEAAILKA